MKQEASSSLFWQASACEDNYYIYGQLMWDLSNCLRPSATVPLACALLLLSSPNVANSNKNETPNVMQQTLGNPDTPKRIDLRPNSDSYYIIDTPVCAAHGCG